MRLRVCQLVTVGVAVGSFLLAGCGGGASSSSTTPTTNRSTTPPTSKEPSTTAANGAQLVWSDEFDGPSGAEVNSADWNQQVGAPPGPRVEYDTPGTHNVALDGQGDLAVTARREDYNGRGYTSARLESNEKMTAGYLEFRAKLSTWEGSVPTLWAYGADGYNAKTQYIEADCVEMRTTAGQEPTGVHQTIHASFPADNSGDHLWLLGWSQNMPSTAPAKVGDAFHTFGVYINPAAPHDVTFYFDRVPHGHYTPSQPVYDQVSKKTVAPGNWPFGTIPMKAVVEVEMGFFSGGVISTDRDSDTMLVDYVRMYDRPPF